MQIELIRTKCPNTELFSVQCPVCADLDHERVSKFGKIKII